MGDRAPASESELMHWSRFSGHDVVPHAALFTALPAYCGHPWMKEIKQDAAVPGKSRHADRRGDDYVKTHVSLHRPPVIVSQLRAIGLFTAKLMAVLN